MTKIKFTIALILLLGVFSFGFYVIVAGGVSYKNNGKKALINGKDTCIIQSEEKDFWMKAHPRKITVLYKDNNGKYTQQEFQEYLITIIK